MNHEIVACFAVYVAFMNSHGNNENTSVKMVILSVVQNYLIVIFSVENTAVKLVMTEDWETYCKKYENSPHEMSQITVPLLAITFSLLLSSSVYTIPLLRICLKCL
jgi:hypothetical protein